VNVTVVSCPAGRFTSVLQLNVMALAVTAVTAHVMRMPVDDFSLMDAKASGVEKRVVLCMNSVPVFVLTTVNRGIASPKIASACWPTALNRYTPQSILTSISPFSNLSSLQRLL